MAAHHHGRHPHQAALPLYDYFLDLPHPAAAKASRPPVILVSPATSPDMERELHANLSRIGRFAFPEFDDAAAEQVPRDTELNRFSMYAMQPKTFQHYTFSLQIQNGVRVHGHVRRYHPIHDVVKTRYDVGRRGERALVLLTRANGGDLVYAAILKYVLRRGCFGMALSQSLFGGVVYSHSFFSTNTCLLACN